MTDNHERRAKEFQESVWVAMEGWEVLPREWTEEVELLDELHVFSSLDGTGVSVVLEGFSSESAADESVDAILNRTESAPEPDNVRVSEVPYREDWEVRCRFFSDD
ncbi:hypothetical protein [Halorubrum sp. Eb13]|uniref:hypothetical protein n=1 Tax=Halorubrum sp. Eb13 TaxID=1383843 RepID=UPI000B99618E|nr:hypothetical protein [Halorubrum sp. Eb13]OYR42881.1 hypothetical protein DJ75_12345 [Halorubrum sp. Eb13]